MNGMDGINGMSSMSSVDGTEAVCLSLAPALRCVGLSLIEEVAILLPAFLEVIFSLGLIFVKCDANRTRYILAAEGPTYLLLALLSFLNRLMPIFENSLKAHKILDIMIGAASCIPILLYTSYLFILKREEFFPRLPRRFAFIASAFAVVVIPIIIVTSEVDSFLGVRYRQVPSPEGRVVGNLSAVGPYLASFQFAREFLGSASLALLAIYQAITFLLFFMRLASCILAQRDIEVRAAAEREGMIFRGTGWLVIGITMSTIESAVGFAITCFGIILTRRILRMLGRACIIIGIVKGLDRKEEFLILESDKDKDSEFLSGTRKLKVAPRQSMISNPRLVQSSMSQRISQMSALPPRFSAFAPPPTSSTMIDIERTPLTSRPSSDLSSDWPTDTSAATAKSRPTPLKLKLERNSSESHVSVVHGRNHAPTLVLNLSPMKLASNDIFAPMSKNETQTSSSTIDIDYVQVASMPLSVPAQRSAPLPRLSPLVTAALPGIPPRYSESEGLQSPQDRQRPRKQSSRRRSLPPAVPPIPADLPRTSAPVPPTFYAWPSIEPGRAEGVVESPQSLRAASAQRSDEGSGVSPRSRADESQSTVGAFLIDWISPETETRVARIKTVGAVPRRRTPTPTSAGATRNSVALERHETLPLTRDRSRRELPRKDSGVLGEDDPALVRQASPRSQWYGR